MTDAAPTPATREEKIEQIRQVLADGWASVANGEPIRLCNVAWEIDNGDGPTGKIFSLSCDCTDEMLAIVREVKRRPIGLLLLNQWNFLKDDLSLQRDETIDLVFYLICP